MYVCLYVCIYVSVYDCVSAYDCVSVYDYVSVWLAYILVSRKSVSHYWMLGGHGEGGTHPAITGYDLLID